MDRLRKFSAFRVLAALALAFALAAFLPSELAADDLQGVGTISASGALSGIAGTLRPIVRIIQWLGVVLCFFFAGIQGFKASRGGDSRAAINAFVLLLFGILLLSPVGILRALGADGLANCIEPMFRPVSDVRCTIFSGEELTAEDDHYW